MWFPDECGDEDHDGIARCCSGDDNGVHLQEAADRQEQWMAFGGPLTEKRVRGTGFP